jgi:phenylpropionate dioxygenase-like ring-hydroxylating dioxygenase large terminal subunit
VVHDAFAAEQRALARACWQLVGITDDLAGDDAWIRRSLFGTDMFVQRFEGELRAFYNACAHRGFPLRREDAGSGPVKCGFHGWAYNRDGVPTTIPRNAELFGLSREQREALALPAIRVDVIGRFVFAALGAAPPLGEYLGLYADILRATSGATGPLVFRDSAEIAADWTRHAEISLDDYHLSSIHGTTFGAGEPLPLNSAVYRRDGLHSCYLKRRDPDWSFDGFWRDIAAGQMDRTGYKIFNMFPGVVLATMRDVCIASTVVPLSTNRSRVDNYVLAWRDAPLTDDAAAQITAYFTTVFREDHAACERWHLGDPGRAVLGKLEERVGWFREAYVEVIRREGADR